MFGFPQPQIPGALMANLFHLKDTDGGTRDKAHGNAFIPAAPERISFKGCLMPVTDKDLQNAPQGLYSAESMKLYTNGYALLRNEQVEDPKDRAVYTVMGDLNHGGIHPLRRYVVERKGRTASR